MKIWKKFKYAIFDADGTLVDIMPVYTKMFCRLAKENFGIPENISGQYYLKTAGTILPAQFRGILEKQKIRLNKEKIKTMVSAFFKESAQQNPSLFPETRNALLALKNNGMNLFAMTGSDSRDTIARFERNGILQIFSMILGSEKIPKGPRHIEEFAKYRRISLEEFSRNAFLCGDGVRDMEIAKQMEIFAIGIANTLSHEKLKSGGANSVIKNIRQLLNLEF